MRNYNYKKKIRNNQLVNSKKTKKVVTAFALSSLLLSNTLPAGADTLTVQNIKNAPSVGILAANSLAEVQLLTDVAINANLTDAGENYNLALGLTGTGLADAELLTPDRLAVFYIPELAGKMEKDGAADVRVEILPITMEDLPALNNLVGNLTGSVTDLVTGLTTTLDATINETQLSGVVQVDGLTELNAALDNLNNLDQALTDLLAYEGQADVVINPDGTVTIDFSDGLGQHLETAVKDVVTNAVTEVLDAVDGIEVTLLSESILLGPILNELVINPIVNPLKSAVVNTANPILEGLTDGTIDLTNALAGVQVIGRTTVNANVKVVKPAEANGEVTVYGAGVSDPAIDVQLITGLSDTATIVFDEEDDTDADDDVTAPNAPDVNSVTDADTEVTGTGEPGATVTVTTPGGTYEGEVDEEGNFSVDIPAQEAGTEITVTLTDDADNESEATVVTVSDATVPDAPDVNPVTDADTAVIGSGEPGATVTVTTPGGTYEGEVDEEGNFSVDIPAQEAGTEITVTLTDDADNESEATVVTVSDVAALEAPFVDFITDADTAVTGAGEPGATVTVTTPGGTYEGEVDEEGNFSVDIPAQEAVTEITVTLTDDADNESEATVVTVSDATAPDAPAVDPVTDADTEVTGSGEPGATVTVTTLGGTYEGEVDEEGNYSVDIPAQEAGTEITVTLTDDADNESEATVVTVSDVTAPDAPGVDPVTDSEIEVTGSGEPGTTVTVTTPGDTYEGEVDEEGNYSVDIPAQDAGTELTVTLTDDADNESEATVVTVSDATAPDAPAVDPVTDADTAVTGSGEPGATVTVSAPGDTYEGEVDEEGDFSVDIPAQEADTEITVTLTDKAGNVSNPTIVVVSTDDDDIALDVPTANPITETDLVITGKGTPGLTVIAKVDGVMIGTAVVLEDGTFNIELEESLPAGTDVELLQTDEQEKLSESTFVTVEAVDKDSDGDLDVPTANPITETDLEITGKGTPGLTVIAKVDGVISGTAIVSEDGTFIIELEESLPAGTEVELLQTDEQENWSESVFVTVEAVKEDKDGDFDGDANAGADADSDSDTNPSLESDTNTGGKVVIRTPGSNDGEFGYNNNQGSKLPKTATALWTMGLTGLGALFAGAWVKIFGRRKK